MIINVTYDRSVAAAPSGFKAVVNAVVRFLDRLYSSPIQINIDVGYGEIDGTPLDNAALGESSEIYSSYSYEQVKNALAANPSSSEQESAAASLPQSDPTNGGVIDVATAEADALGLAAGGALDGYVGFRNTTSFNYDLYDRSIANEYDFAGVVEHEITEVMGRSSSLGEGTFSVLDLFRFSSPETRIFDPTQNGYFSVDNGVTDLDSFNTDPNGDFGDWAGSAGNDAFLAFTEPGIETTLSASDVNVMNALGFRLSAVTHDFSDDGRSDILFRNASGLTYLWEMNNFAVSRGSPLSLQVGANWQIDAIGDFNGDGSADLLWRYEDGGNSSDPLNGATYMWLQNGATSTAIATSWQTDQNWQVQGAGDFDGDGASDILWRNSTNGETYIWEMNGGQVLSSSGPTSAQVANLNWEVVAINDFNADGRSDIVWRYDNASNASDPLNGDVYLWEMNGTSVSAEYSAGNPGANWQVAGAGDFFGDGNADVLWRYENGSNTEDPLNGVTYIWDLNGPNVVAQGPTQWQTDNSWVISGIGDYSGNGLSDILWQQKSSGDTYIWDMNGFNVASGGWTSQQAGPGWAIENGALVG